MGDPPGLQSPCLQGTYIQLINNNGSWDKAAWSRQFKALQDLQIDNLIVQWTVYDDMAFYRSGQFRPHPMPPLETLLDLADSAGMRMMVGLSQDSEYWSRIRQADKQPYLIERLRKNMTVAAELQPLVLKHKSFVGWYINEEIDDVHWNVPEARSALFNYLQQLSTYLHTATPAAAVGISGFANKHTRPAELELFWSALLRRAGAIGIVYFQDGIGVGKLTLDVLPQYYDAIRNAAQVNKREFVPVIEAFRQVSGEPISEGPFAAAPPDLQRLARQLELAGQFSTRNVAFGVPEYLTPAGRPAASQAYAEFLRLMRCARSRVGEQSITP